MSHLVRLIDAYKDKHGQPSDSSVARAIGVKPQTLSSWRTRGIKEPPDRNALRKLALLAGADYETEVLRAALLDAGWIEESDGDDRDAAPMNQAARRGGLTQAEREEAVDEGRRRRPKSTDENDTSTEDTA